MGRVEPRRSLISRVQQSSLDWHGSRRSVSPS